MAKNKECPTVHSVPECLNPSPNDSQVTEKWRMFEPKVRYIANQFQIRGLVGADIDDLVADAYWLLLTALRTYDANKAAFSTYYYHLVRNHFTGVRKLCSMSRWKVVVDQESIRDSLYVGMYVTVISTGTSGTLIELTGEMARVRLPKRKETEVAVSNLTPKIECLEVAVSNLTPKIECLGEWHLRDMTTRLQSAGVKFEVENITGNRVRIPHDRHLSIFESDSSEEDVSRGGEVTLGDLGSLADATALQKWRSDTPGHDQLMRTIFGKVKDLSLRKIMLYLYRGKTTKFMRKRFGLNQLQYERNLARLRMLLAGEFDIRLAT